MLQMEYSAILLTFIKLPFVIKIFVLSIFEWPLKTGFTLLINIPRHTGAKEDRDKMARIYLHCMFRRLGLHG